MFSNHAIRTSLVRQSVHAKPLIPGKLSLTLSEPDRQHSSRIFADLPGSSFTGCFGSVALPIVRHNSDKFFLVHNVPGLQRATVDRSRQPSN